MHLSSNGNKTIKDRMPAPAGRSFFYTRDTPTIGEISSQPGTNENPESFRTDKLPEKVKPSHSRNKVNPVCKPFQPILAVYLFAGGGGGLCSLLHFMEVLRACAASVLPHLTSILFPSFCLFWETIFFVCDMFFLVLFSLSFFIFFYYFLFATVTLVKKIKDAAQEFL